MMIHFKLWQLSRRAQPDAAFVARLDAALRERGAFVGKVGLFAFRMAGAACALVLVLGGTTTYAYASESVLPDHPLYSLRETVESLEASTALSTEAKASVQRKLLERRLNEIRVMRGRRLAILPQAVTRLRETMVRLEATTTAEGVMAIDAWNALLRRRVRTLDKREAARLQKEADEAFKKIENRVKVLQQKAQKLRPGALKRK
jgi:hypothetical protein